MSKGSRYNTSGLGEDTYEPGSRGRVLKNKLGITRKRNMDEVETREQFRALNIFVETYDSEHRFIARDIYVICIESGWAMFMSGQGNTAR